MHLSQIDMKRTGAKIKKLCKEKGIIKQGLYNQYIREGNLETREYPEMERGDLLND